VTSDDSPAVTPRLLSLMSSSSPENCSSSSEWPDRAAVSRSNRYLFDTNAQARCAGYLDLMRLEVDALLGRLRGGVTGLESYALPGNGHAIGGAHLGMSLDVMLIEIDERFNALKLLMGPDAVGDLALALEDWVLDPCCHSVLFLPRIWRTLSDLLLAFLMLPVSLFHEHQLFDEIY
jgi:hypothetical protein